MNALKLTTKPTSIQNVFNVYWFLGKNSNGLLEIGIARAVEDKAVIAELFALRHLLVVKNICGENRVGEGMEIIVSSGAIKRAQRSDTEKHHLIRYAHFLATRFRDAKIEVRKDAPWIGEVNVAQDGECVERINADTPIDETIHINGFGDAVLTRHALERYMERNKVVSFSRAFKSIQKIAAAEGLRPVSVSNNMAIKKHLKHGVRAMTFNHADSMINLVVSQEDGGRNVLSTVVFEDITTRPKLPVYRGAFRVPF